MKYRIRVYMDWRSCGTVEVEADDAEEAKDAAMERLMDGDVDWEDAVFLRHGIEVGERHG